MEFATSTINFLNENSGAIQSLSTVILVIITAIYVWFTYRMSSFMAKQITPKIEISNIVLGDEFSEDGFKKERENNPEQNKRRTYFEFKLLFDIYNKGAGNGSIEKPILVMKFVNDNFRYKLSPKTKETHRENKREYGGMTTWDEITNDLGGSIFLRGGEIQKIELEYYINNCSGNLLEHIQNNLGSLEYQLEYKDSLGDDNKIKINKIQSERETFRR